MFPLQPSVPEDNETMSRCSKKIWPKNILPNYLSLEYKGHRHVQVCKDLGNTLHMRFFLEKIIGSEYS